MKRQSIFIVLLLLQVLFICCGCGSSEKSAESPEAAAVTEEAAAEEATAPLEAPADDTRQDVGTVEEASLATAETESEPAAYSGEKTQSDNLEEEIIANQKASNLAKVEDAVGIFEGLEDNHTALFSFDGAETAFYFEDPAVQSVLFEAVLGSTYTLSYNYDDSLGYVIYKISE